MRIIEKFSKCREAKTETIVKNFKECLHSFNKDWPVGYDENERRVPLKESFELHVRDKSENKSRRATQELLDALNW